MSLKSNKLIFSTDMKRKSSGKRTSAHYVKSSTPTASDVREDIPDLVDEFYDEDLFDTQDEFSK